MNNKKKIILSVLVVLLLLAIGVTYAFFTYENGTKSEIVTGQIYMNYEETSTISLTGVFPETKAQALARQDENGVFEFTITGRNTSKYPVYYEIDLLEGGVITGKTETSTKILPEHVRIYLERDGEPLVDGMTYKDWNNRRIYVDTVPANQTSNIEHKYTLRMWIDENVTISNTNPEADYTTSEWNDAYTSLKVRVVGDFNPKELPGTMARLGTDYMFWEQSILNASSNIKEVNFIQLDNSDIDTRYNAASIKSDVSTSTEYPVKTWLEVNETDLTKYTMYVASEEEIYFPSDCSRMFLAFSSLEKINFNNVNTSSVTNMAIMFAACSNLINLDISNFDMSSVTTMSSMFADCTKLISLDLSGWDTSQVIVMSATFTNCNKLQQIIGIEEFYTSNVTDMHRMFDNCSLITTLDLSRWDTGNVESSGMNQMFNGCSSLKEIIGIENFDTSKVTNLGGMFGKCNSLTDLDLTRWNVSNVTTMANMFDGCKSLTSLDLSTWNMSKVTNDLAMFQNVSKATEIKLPNNVKVIGDFMFNHNSAHTGETFTIPASVTTIGKTHMWYGFGTNFKEFIVADGNTNFKTIDGVLYSKDGTRFVSVPTHKTFENRTFTIPEGVTFIGESNFSTNKNIDTLVLPDSYVITRYVGKSNANYNKANVNYGNSLFLGIYYRTSISEYVVKDTNPNYTSVDGCIYSKNGTELIAVPWQYNSALNIKEGTTTIGQEAFSTQGAASSETTKLTSVHIPASVTTIQSAQLTALNKLVGRITITIDDANPNYTISGGKIVAK